MSRRRIESLRWELGLVALLFALLIPIFTASGASAANPLDTFTLELRARLHQDGRIEFGLRVDSRTLEPRARFVPAAVDHQRWFVSSALELDGFETQVIARRLADGRTQFGLRLDGVDVLPRRAFFPATARVGRWLRSQPVVVDRPGDRADDDERLLLARAAAIRASATVPDLTGLVGWLNGEPTSIALELAKGNVVLIDFWTFACYNCRNTLPYLIAWDEKYREHGLVILGVHTPEFEFEEVPANIREAIARYGIEYSVPLDTNYRTWRAFRNRFWPAKYLIGPTANADMGVRYRHFGEGRYERTERAIRRALEAVGRDLSDVPIGVNVSRSG